VILPATYMTKNGLTVEDAGPELLSRLLSALESERAIHGEPTHRILAPGQSRSEILKQLSPIGLTPPEELVVWWEWSNGLLPGRKGRANFEPFSVQEAIDLYREEQIGEEFYEWNRDWIRVSWEPNAGMAVSCEQTGRPPLVRNVSPTSGTQQAETDCQVVSLCTPVTWWLLGLAKGWTVWDDTNQRWQSDIREFPLEWSLTQLV
jgi:hypothetical protein